MSRRGLTLFRKASDIYDEHPTTKRIVLTLLGWGVGLLAVLGLIVAMSTAMAPKTPPDTPRISADATSATATPSVVAAPITQPAEVPPAVTPPSPVPAPRRTPTRTPKKPLEGKTVVIDAGHQARGDSSLEPIGPGSSTKKPKVASGATGVQTRNPESLINLRVALRLQKELVRRGATVVMVRTTQSVNIANSRRAAIANEAHADLFIRLHCDSSANRSVVGLTTLVPASNSWTRPILAESKKAGVFVHRAVISETAANDRGVVDRGDLSGFNWATVPTVLVEMGFMSNPGEDVKLGAPSYQQQLAVGLAMGIENYLAAY